MDKRTLLGRNEVPEPIQARQIASSSQSSQDEDDPYQEILRTYNDNVSHLVFHGSSLKSMSNLDFESMNQHSGRTDRAVYDFRRGRRVSLEEGQ
ncbi:hypothetical protein COOONC_08979 [Cooperia oncophora]